MAYYYVKTGGIKTSGNSANPLTGSFASIGAAGYYPTIDAVIAIGLVDGDYVIVSHVHTEVEAAAIGFWTSTGLGAGLDGLTAHQIVNWVSVDDTDVSVELRGAYLEAGTNFVSGANTSVTGFILKALTTTSKPIAVSSDDHLFLNNCKIMQASPASITLTNPGSALHLIDCEIETSRATSTICNNIDDNAELVIDNCTFTTTGSGTWSQVFSNFSAASRGFNMKISNCDFSGFLAGLVGGGMDADSDDLVILDMFNCKIPAGQSVFTPTTNIAKGGTKVSFIRCGNGASAEYQYLLVTDGGYVEDDSNIYRNSSLAWPLSGVKTSYAVVARSTTTRTKPFKFTLPTSYVKLSRGDSQTIRVHFLATSATLTTADLWARVSFPTAADPSVFETVTTEVSLLKAGTTHTLVGGTTEWYESASLTTKNDYYLDIPCGTGPAGADTAVDVELYIGLASLAVWFDPDITTL